ncbi:hypothetical protein VM1G_06363 [Cytospora mali]|uniref:F-box domain-containing protein n=1 Tax=Cytospora mali TaxID=578113 RepID=A0A194W2E0_CYTMA|nr:hypothetical protein VM1G_06363 [Valsa mali]
MQSQDSGLVHLPQEMLNSIARFLPTDDFNALRLTCKPIEDKIFPYWANCFFRKRQFMIDHFSLKALVDISQHRALSKIMTHLVIGLDDFKIVNIATLAHDPEHYRQWRSASSGQQALLQTGVAIDILSTALANLPNLKTIDIRDFNSFTRYRDATEWRSYGRSFYGDWLKTQHGASRPSNFISNVFQVVLAAIDRCSPELESFEVIMRRVGVSLRDDAFACFPALGTGLTRTLNGLTKLHLDQVGSLNDDILWRPSPRVNTHSAHQIIYLRKFLSFTTSVTWLRLNFTIIGMDAAVSTQFLKWLGLESDCGPSSGEMGWDEMNPAPVALPLRRLDLGQFSVEPDVIYKILTKFSGIENLCLRHVTLQLRDDQPSGPGLLGSDGKDEDGDCVWAKFIRGLSVFLPRLKHISISSLLQTYRGREQRTFFYIEGKSLREQSVTNIDDAKLEHLADVTLTRESISSIKISAERHVDPGDSSHGEDDEDVDGSDEGSDQDQVSESLDDDSGGET